MFDSVSMQAVSVEYTVPQLAFASAVLMAALALYARFVINPITRSVL